MFIRTQNGTTKELVNVAQIQRAAYTEPTTDAPASLVIVTTTTSTKLEGSAATETWQDLEAMRPTRRAKATKKKAEPAKP